VLISRVKARIIAEMAATEVSAHISEIVPEDEVGPQLAAISEIDEIPVLDDV